MEWVFTISSEIWILNKSQQKDDCNSFVSNPMQYPVLGSRSQEFLKGARARASKKKQWEPVKIP